MKISLNWLKRYLDFEKQPSEVAEAVTRLGLEVESIETFGVPPNPLLVVGEVLSRQQHPNADKLSVCKVDAGTGAPLQIVCGATNFKVGDRVPVALVGCTLGSGNEKFTIKAAKLRGVESQGMMCAADEIGLGGTHEGLLILNDRPSIGARINTLIPSDTVFEVKATPNRADALSHLGVARDLAAAWGLALKNIPAPDIAPSPCKSFKGISIDNFTDCSHYRGYIIRGVKVGSSPAWLQDLLKAVGARPISNIVDITNYICLGLGQPMHAFDLNKINGNELKVRRGREGEKLLCLDGPVRTTDANILVIADSQQPLAMAGIIGGKDSSVTEATTDILLEAANFSPALTRKTSRAKSVSSDSSYRFERGIDPLITQPAAEFAVKMILEICGGTLEGGAQVAGQAPFTPRSFTVSRQFIVRQLGFDISAEKIQKALTAFGFSLKPIDPQQWQVSAPSYRNDIEAPVDIIEELLRYTGVDQIPSGRLLLPAIHANDSALYAYIKDSSTQLISLGYNECLHYTLRSTQEAQGLSPNNSQLQTIENPLSSDMSALRSSLIPGLIEALQLNSSRGNKLLPLFESGHVFQVLEGRIVELQSLAFVHVISPAAQSWDKTVQPLGFFQAKAILNSLLLRAGVAQASWQSVGSSSLWQPHHSAFGHAGSVQAHAGIVNLEIVKKAGFSGIVLGGEIILLLDAFQKPHSLPRYSPFSVFPGVRRDVALIVPQPQPAAEVAHLLHQAVQSSLTEQFQLESIDLFDVYTGIGLPEGHKSLAYAMHFRSLERTLTDDEVATVFNNILTSLKSSGLQIRS